MGVKIEALGLENARKYQTNIRKTAAKIRDRYFSPFLFYDFTFWLSGRMKILTEITRPVHAFTSKIIEERSSMSRSNETGPIQDDVDADDDNDNV